MLDFEDESENANYGLIAKLFLLICAIVGMVILGMSLLMRRRTEKDTALNVKEVEEPTESQNTTILPVKLDKSELNELITEHFELDEPESTIGFQQANDESTKLRQQFEDTIKIDSVILYELLQKHFDKPFKALYNNEVTELVQIINHDKKIYDSLDIDSQFAILNWKTLENDDPS
ncbi:hypothetical protein [Cellulophaga sp. BC115SP]|uniref:hypothetical protein n=1 Tax=Cellulophaga sp. BC115SP TaxID=2683263 RepID=UPI001412734F|nr:hypothetical protein [Cellulophaga sp. BC115SP]NBB31650.1 hypothetical protein [Cellulophaga sp. BC115SP]